jgi:hypothetical protein
VHRFHLLLRRRVLEEHHAALVEQKLAVTVEHLGEHDPTTFNFLLVAGDLDHEVHIVESCHYRCDGRGVGVGRDHASNLRFDKVILEHEGQLSTDDRRNEQQSKEV